MLERETRTGAHIPIVATTTNAMRGDSDRCLAADMDAYMSKPITAELLNRTLDDWAKAPPSASRDQLSGARRREA